MAMPPHQDSPRTQKQLVFPEAALNREFDMRPRWGAKQFKALQEIAGPFLFPVPGLRMQPAI
jgi:hypothetical protein